MIMPIIMKIH